RCGGDDLGFHVAGVDASLNSIELDYYGIAAFDTAEPMFRLLVATDLFQNLWGVNTSEGIGSFSEMEVEVRETGLTATGPSTWRPIGRKRPLLFSRANAEG